MAVVKRANALSVASSMMKEMTTGIADKLREFCVRKMVESGLISKTFPHQFRMDSPLEGRKTIARLKTILIKHLIKTIPYLSFSQDEFIQVSDRDFLMIHLFTRDYPEGVDTNSVEWEKFGLDAMNNYKLAYNSGNRGVYLNNCKEFKSLNRYCRYLNYLFRKHHIPAKLEFMPELNYDQQAYQEARQLPISERYAKVLPAKMVVKLRLCLVRWTCGGSRSQRYENVVNGNNVDDALFSYQDFWNSTPIHHGHPICNPLFYRYSFEKLFLNIDKGVRMLNTLTRKVCYGSAAFSIRDISNS